VARIPLQSTAIFKTCLRTSGARPKNKPSPQKALANNAILCYNQLLNETATRWNAAEMFGKNKTSVHHFKNIATAQTSP
jgi:hypothetical protein